MRWETRYSKLLKKHERNLKKHGTVDVWFAWYPVELQGGNMVWLEKYSDIFIIAVQLALGTSIIL